MQQQSAPPSITVRQLQGNLRLSLIEDGSPVVPSMLVHGGVLSVTCVAEQGGILLLRGLVSKRLNQEQAAVMSSSTRIPVCREAAKPAGDGG